MCKYALKHSVFFLEAAPSFSFYCPFRAPVKCAMMKGEWKRSVKHVKQPRNPRRLVVKVGTSTLTRETGSLNLQNMEHLARVLADLEGMGYQPVLVSSGAIGIGTKKLRLGERPTELRMKQAAAAVGQCRMMHIYDKLFAEYNRTVAQILLTGEDVESPVRSEHLHNTFEALLELGVIPVVNENDSVSSAEIETGQCKVLGDNDTLSAIVARLCGAGLLVLFSDIDGLYDADPRTHPDARLIHQVEAITPELPGHGRRCGHLARHRRHGPPSSTPPSSAWRRGGHGHRQRGADGGPLRHRGGEERGHPLFCPAGALQ